MLSVDKTQMVTKDQALTGRPAPMQIVDRHAVLGTPLKDPWPEGMEVLYVAMGCFWGAERIFWQLDGVYTTAAGYMGGWTANPTYQEVCTAMTGHAEVVQVVFNPQQISLETLFAAFWENHDPTTPARQGNDIGTQYRSAIFATSPAQFQAARASAEQYQRRLTDEGFGLVSTQIALTDDAGDGQFYYAEDYHQQYLYKNPGGYCNHGFCQVSYAAASDATAH